MKRSSSSAALLSGLLLAACSTPPAEQPERSFDPQSPSGIAVRVVAERTGMDPGQLQVRSSEFREFSDSGLGCPVPGRSYLQVITPGHQVIVTADGRDYDVRVAGNRGRICDRGETTR